MVAQVQPNVLEAALQDDYFSIEVSIREGYNAFVIEPSGMSIVEHAIASGNRNLLTTIVENMHTVSNKDAYTLLSKAIDYKQIDMVKYLLGKNFHAEMNSVEMYNLVCLTLQHDYADIYRLFTEYSPAIDNHQMDFLSIAANSDKFDIFSFIFKYKNLKTSEKLGSESLIHQAANSLPIITFLINKGADVNALTTNGHTPLHLTKDLKIAQLLIKNGAIVNVEDNEGHTPLYYAQKAGDTAMVRLFERALEK